MSFELEAIKRLVEHKSESWMLVVAISIVGAVLVLAVLVRIGMFIVQRRKHKDDNAQTNDTERNVDTAVKGIDIQQVVALVFSGLAVCICSANVISSYRGIVGDLNGKVIDYLGDTESVIVTGLFSHESNDGPVYDSFSIALPEHLYDNDVVIDSRNLDSVPDFGDRISIVYTDGDVSFDNGRLRITIDSWEPYSGDDNDNEDGDATPQFEGDDVNKTDDDDITFWWEENDSDKPAAKATLSSGDDGVRTLTIPEPYDAPGKLSTNPNGEFWNIEDDFISCPYIIVYGGSDNGRLAAQGAERLVLPDGTRWRLADTMRVSQGASLASILATVPDDGLVLQTNIFEGDEEIDDDNPVIILMYEPE